MKRLQTIGEISYYVDRSKNTVRKWVKKEGFPAVKVGGIWESKTEQIDKWLEKKHQYNEEFK